MARVRVLPKASLEGEPLVQRSRGTMSICLWLGTGPRPSWHDELAARCEGLMATPRPLSIPLALITCVGSLTACQGQIGSAPDTSGGQPAGTGTGVGSPAGGVDMAGRPLSLPPTAGMRRLTSEEFTRAIRDLLGASL